MNPRNSEIMCPFQHDYYCKTNCAIYDAENENCAFLQLAKDVFKIRVKLDKLV